MTAAAEPMVPASPTPFTPSWLVVLGVTVESVTMLGTSVVSVKHAINPRGGKISPTTWAFLGLAGLWLVIGLIGFGRGYSNASFNAGKRHQWIEVEKRPSWAFRPKKLGIENDIMMFLGLPLGLGFAIAGLMRLRDEKQSNPFFRIGQDQSCEYPTSDAPAGSFALVAPSSNPSEDFVFNFLPGMEGEVSSDGQSMSLAELQSQGRARPSSTAPGGLEMSIPQKARIRVKAGQTTYLVTSVPQPKRQPVPVLAGLESQVLLFFLGSAVAHIGFWFILKNVGRWRLGHGLAAPRTSRFFGGGGTSAHATLLVFQIQTGTEYTRIGRVAADRG